MKRVLIITGQLAKNGTETFIMNVWRKIDKKSFHFDFLVGKHVNDGYEFEAQNLGAKIYAIPFSRIGFVKHLKELCLFFKKHAKEYDAIHYNANSFCSLEILILAKQYGIKDIIVHAHNSQTTGIHNIVLHKFYRHFIDKIASKYIACSDLAKIWGYAGTSAYNKVRIIPNGIDLNKYMFNPKIRETKRKELGLTDEFVIGTVGRLVTVKNHSFLIDVFIEILSQINNAKLIIVGIGELKDSLEAKVEKLGIKNKVIFTGLRHDVPQLLNAFDSFVLPSLYEGLPFVGIEAQANGLQTFISSSVSSQIILTNNIHLLSLNEPPKRWADNILKYNTANRNIDIEHCKINDYSIDKTITMLEDVYTKQV